MNAFDEARRLRLAESGLGEEITRLGPSQTSGMPCLVARTTTLSTYPTVAAQYFACNPVTVLGNEAEGATGAVSPDSTVFFALNLGSTIPPTGTLVLATFVGNRWVFRYDG